MSRTAPAGPLSGRRVMVTRAASQARKLSDALRAQGAAVVEIPLIDFEAPRDPAPARQALKRLDTYDFIAVTSANAVPAVDRIDPGAWSRLARLESPVLLAVGPATARALAERGVKSARTPATFSGEGLAEALRDVDLAGRSVLLLRAETGHHYLPGWLRQQGARVDVVAVYRTVTTGDSINAIRSAVHAGVDAVTLTSPSAVEALRGALADSFKEIPILVFACIGPTTAAAAKQAGLGAEIVAGEASVDGLVTAVCAYFALQPERI